MIITLPAWVPSHRPRTARRTSVGWCVRMDWPDGTHSLTGYGTTHTAAARRVPGLRRYWSRGPAAPAGYRVVAISRHDWRLHARRPRCASPDCPS